jgi:hypothetical protein
LEPILKPTKGQVVYQEQIAQIVHLLGDNVSLEEGNQLRKLFIKKGAGKDEDKKTKIYEKYIRGCAKKKIPNGDAEKLWKALELFNFYAFNKCLSQHTLVETANGVKKIKDVVVGEFVNSAQGMVAVKKVIKQGPKKVFRIKTSQGKELVCTLEHKLETPHGMKTLREILAQGERVLCK